MRIFIILLTAIFSTLSFAKVMVVEGKSVQNLTNYEPQNEFKLLAKVNFSVGSVIVNPGGSMPNNSTATVQIPTSVNVHYQLCQKFNNTSVGLPQTFCRQGINLTYKVTLLKKAGTSWSTIGSDGTGLKRIISNQVFVSSPSADGIPLKHYLVNLAGNSEILSMNPIFTNLTAGLYEARLEVMSEATVAGVPEINTMINTNMKKMNAIIMD